MGTACCRSNQDDNCKLSCYDLSIFQRWYDCKDKVKNSAKNIDDVVGATPSNSKDIQIAARGAGLCKSERLL